MTTRSIAAAILALSWAAVAFADAPDPGRFNGTYQLVNGKVSPPQPHGITNCSCSQELQITNNPDQVVLMTSEQGQPDLSDGGRILPNWDFAYKEIAPGSYVPVGQILVLSNTDEKNNSCNGFVSCKLQGLIDDENNYSSFSQPKQLGASAENSSNSDHKRISIRLKLTGPENLEYKIDTLLGGDKSQLSCTYRKVSETTSLQPRIDGRKIFTTGPDDTSAPGNSQ